MDSDVDVEARDLSVVASDSAPLAPAPDAIPASDEEILNQLSQSGLWEKAPYPVTFAVDFAPTDTAAMASEDYEDVTALAEQDDAWYSEDGDRYEALYVLADGRSYGRLGPAPDAAPPSEDNGYGASLGVSVAEEQPGFDPDLHQRTNDPGPLPALIGTNITNDRRARISSSSSLISYPNRMIGAISSNGAAGSVDCTGGMIGPRHVLTASHCMRDAAGQIRLPGRFNPGQTNTSSALNGSHAWVGLLLRDWRVPPSDDYNEYDYAVLGMVDSSQLASLGWFGVAWWNNASSYNGRWAGLKGYPCGPNAPNSCGATSQQRCAASPRSDKRCDGWMYFNGRYLTSTSYQSGGWLEFDNDASVGQSGAPAYANLSGNRVVLAVATWAPGGVGTLVRGPRFRTSMWNDVCSWIANWHSAHGQHSLCH